MHAIPNTAHRKVLRTYVDVNSIWYHKRLSHLLFTTWKVYTQKKRGTLHEAVGHKYGFFLFLSVFFPLSVITIFNSRIESRLSILIVGLCDSTKDGLYRFHFYLSAVSLVKRRVTESSSAKWNELTDTSVYLSSMIKRLGFRRNRMLT